jgi:hypothetical protein
VVRWMWPRGNSSNCITSYIQYLLLSFVFASSLEVVCAQAGMCAFKDSGFLWLFTVLSFGAVYHKSGY